MWLAQTDDSFKTINFYCPSIGHLNSVNNANTVCTDVSLFMLLTMRIR